MKIGNDWDNILEKTLKSEETKRLEAFIDSQYETERIFPPKECLFSAFELTPYKKVRVVILGQDPYHEPGQAHGLAFSVMPGTRVPPSLANIYKELESELNILPPPHGCLESWARQGVLLLNTVLTVRQGQAGSHKGMGWELFTDDVIRALNMRESPVVFILWGANAGAKAKLITNARHLVLQAPHPSPLSCYRGFFGCGHFKAAQDFLGQRSELIDFEIK